jgi:hypothetical protein
LSSNLLKPAYNWAKLLMNETHPLRYAVALNKPIAIGSPFTLPDSGELWFALRCAETRICSKSPNGAARAWLDWLVEHEGIIPEGVAA